MSLRRHDGWSQPIFPANRNDYVRRPRAKLQDTEMTATESRGRAANPSTFMRPVLFYSDQYVFPLPEGHRFPLGKYRLVRELLAQDGSFDLRPAPLSNAEIIELVHDAKYVRRFIRGELPPATMRRIGFPWSPELVERTLASVGGTLAATQAALEKGLGGTLAGGTHHAFRDEGAGYCVFNDIAVAIGSLRSNRTCSRFAVIDLDVHQGDGTAQIFQDDPAVLTFSMHGDKNFPFRKQRSKLDIELADGATDTDYLYQLQKVLPQVLAFQPEILFYQAGVDPLDTDRLGRLNVSMDGLSRRDLLVFSAAVAAAIPIVVTLGGGYSDPIERTAEAHAQTFRTALRVFTGKSTTSA